MSKEILEKYSIRAKKALGQNFLVDDFIVEEIAYSAPVEWKNIVEVWPGYGALTQKLFEQSPKSLHLVELDTDMIDIIQDRQKNNDFEVWNTDFKIHHTDVLKFQPDFWEEYSVIANIPYYITSPILRHFLYDVEQKPENMVILMQADVGDKILWNGKNKSSVLSLFIEKKCSVWEVIRVPNTSFIPAPKVESSVLHFQSHDNFTEVDDEKFLSLIKKWFSEPRKKLSKNLIKNWFSKNTVEEVFKKLNIWENTRAEALDIYQWIELTKIIS